MSVVTRKPILPVVTITKNDNTLYTFNPFLGTFDFRIQSMTCTPAVDSQGGKFSIKLVSSDASNTNANTILNNIESGNQILIKFGKSNSALTSVMLGVIENITIDEPNANLMYITIDGPDWGSDLLKNRIIQGGKFQRTINTVQYDNTDTSVSIYNLYNTLLTNTSWYPSQDGITAQSQGLVISQSNFDSSLYGNNPTLVPQLLANYEKLDDKLSELDTWANLIHYVGPDKNIYVRPAINIGTSASWLFTDDPNDSIASTWQTGDVGYLEPGTSYKYTVENYKRRVFGIGGDAPQIDQASTTTTSSTNLDTNWLAMKFTPLQYKSYVVQVYVAKIGLPTVSLQFLLVQDNGGQPTGPTISSLTMDPNSVATQSDVTTNPSHGWITFNITAELTTNNNNPYWIVLPKVGTAGNTYAWYNDNGASSTNATSPDGVTWTTHASSKAYAFVYQFSTPIATIYPGVSVTSSDKTLHEEIYRKTFIRDQQTMQKYLITMAQLFLNKKEILSGRVYSPDNMITPFQTVLVRKTKSGLQLTGTMNYFVLGQVTYNFRGGPSGATGEFYVDFQAVRFTSFP